MPGSQGHYGECYSMTTITQTSWESNNFSLLGLAACEQEIGSLQHPATCCTGALLGAHARQGWSPDPVHGGWIVETPANVLEVVVMHSHTVSCVGGASHDALHCASIYQRRALPEEPGLPLHG